MELSGLAKIWMNSLDHSFAWIVRGTNGRSYCEWTLHETKVRWVLGYRRKIIEECQIIIIIEYFYEKLSRCNKAKMGDHEGDLEWIFSDLDNLPSKDYLGPLGRCKKPGELSADL